jgi:hypothetical protein
MTTEDCHVSYELCELRELCELCELCAVSLW